MPVSVAALTPSSSLSYVWSNVIVKAESKMRPFTWTPKSTFITSPCCRTGMDQLLSVAFAVAEDKPIVSPELGE